MKPKKIDLAIIVTFIILFDILSTVLYISRFGIHKLHIQIIRFSLTLLISYSLYKENNVARWLTIIFGFIGAIYALFSLRHIENLTSSILFIFIALILIVISFYLLKRKGWK